MTLAVSGTGVSSGIAVGRVHIFQHNHMEITERQITANSITQEIARLRRALRIARRQLREIKTKIPSNTPDDISAFIDTHLLMMEDSSLTRIPERIIRARQCNAEWALQMQRDQMVQVFDAMDDPYLRTRKDDIDHVVRRVQQLLVSDNSVAIDDAGPSLQEYIILAEELTPADTIVMQHQGVAGFVTEHGGPMSHTAILARSLGIPAVVGVRDLCRIFSNEEEVVIDGGLGQIIGSIDAVSARHFLKQQRAEKRRKRLLAELRETPAITQDGVEIQLMANIELAQDIRTLARVGAAGVGLYRTEFLFMNRPDPPTEDEQLRALRKVIKTLNGKPLSVRTLDIGADKSVAALQRGRTDPANPALGLRAVRYCLKDRALFRTQMRAILRASAAGPVRLMIPMISNLTELMQVYEILDEIKSELRSKRIAYDPNLPVGAIIEVPATAVAADHFAKHLDFFSIGTNDLIQYTLAIDRGDDAVNYLYDPLHPAVLRLICMTLEAGRRAGIPVAMCGEMAGDPKLTALLLGMGLTEFSMHPSSILEVKQAVISSNGDTARKWARKILKSDNPRKMAKYLDQLNRS